MRSADYLRPRGQRRRFPFTKASRTCGLRTAVNNDPAERTGCGNRSIEATRLSIVASASSRSIQGGVFHYSRLFKRPVGSTARRPVRTGAYRAYVIGESKPIRPHLSVGWYSARTIGPFGRYTDGLDR